MCYYKLLEPHVTKHVKNYLTDFTQWDHKELEGYTGKFIYGYRTSGTNLFLIDPFFNALNEVLQTGKSAYFTERGMNEVKQANLSFRGLLNVMAIDPIFTGMNQEKFVIGENGKISHVSTEKMLAEINALQQKSFNLQMQIRRKWYHPEPSYAY